MMLPKIFLLLVSLVFVPASDENLIEWNASRKLSWSDFKGTPNPASTNAALTNSSITVEFGYNEKGLTHSIKCRFNKSLSWVRVKNDYILKHEQGHFDIAEIHARLLHRALLEYSFNSKSVSDDINKIYSATMEKHVQMQKLYDLETNHSLDSAQQRSWNNKIASRLEENEKYKEYK
jgi:hypothetical protein